MRRIPLLPSASVVATLAVLLTAACATAPPASPTGATPPDAEPIPSTGSSATPLPSPPSPDDLVIELADQPVPTTALIQAVSAPGGDVVWASGHSGRWLRSVDAGETWMADRGEGGDSLQFRDVDAFDASTAYLMSAGTGSASRIYRTDDGGRTWMLQYVEERPDAFLDCMAFWDRETGVVYGDAVDGSLFVLRTGDGGATWERVPPDMVPAAQAGEGGFAASGTCAAAASGGRGWIATGNAERARIVSTADRGLTWSATEPPVVGGTGAGLTTVSVRGSAGVALGGVLNDPEGKGAYVAVTDDGGASWTEGGPLALPGPVYGAAVSPDLPGPVVVAVGPGGMDWSVDGGATWRHVDDRAFWAVDFQPGGVGWAAGPGGRIVRITVGAPAAPPARSSGGSEKQAQAASERRSSSR